MRSRTRVVFPDWRGPMTAAARDSDKASRSRGVTDLGIRSRGSVARRRGSSSIGNMGLDTSAIREFMARQIGSQRWRRRPSATSRSRGRVPAGTTRRVREYQAGHFIATVIADGAGGRPRRDRSGFLHCPCHRAFLQVRGPSGGGGNTVRTRTQRVRPYGLVLGTGAGSLDAAGQPIDLTPCCQRRVSPPTPFPIESDGVERTVAGSLGESGVIENTSCGGGSTIPPRELHAGVRCTSLGPSVGRLSGQDRRPIPDDPVGGLAPGPAFSLKTVRL